METLSDLEVSRAFPARRIAYRHDAGALELRPMLASDAERLAADVRKSQRELRRFMPWSHDEAALSPKKQLERLREGEADYFAGRDMVMGLFRDGAMLSMVGLHPRLPLNPAGLEVGYWAPTPFAGQGFTTLAVQIASVYAFDKLGTNRLQVSCDRENVGSRRVIEKVGFAHEGVLRGIIAEGTPELVAGGYEASGYSLGFALFPDTFAALPWVASVRERMRYVNAAGYDVR
jgi:RimJ/RimL family protein N-acetyltransferase